MPILVLLGNIHKWCPTFGVIWRLKINFEIFQIGFQHRKSKLIFRNWSLKLIFEIDLQNWSTKLIFKIDLQNWPWKLIFKIDLQIWSSKLICKIDLHLMWVNHCTDYNGFTVCTSDAIWVYVFAVYISFTMP